MSEFGNAWFLTALILTNDWAKLKLVMMTGDLINRSIFTTEEINDALAFLIPQGFVLINGDKEVMATQKAISYFCDESFRRAGLPGKVERVQRKLDNLEHIVPSQPKEYFTDDDVRAAYFAYRSDIEQM